MILGDCMSDEKISQEVEKAVGNINIEGNDISKHEKKLIANVYIRHQDDLGPNAVGSLLHDIVMKDKEKTNGKKR